MARFTSFDDWSAWMQTVIKENGVGAITGPVMQEVLAELSDTAEYLVNTSGSSADGRALAAEGYAVGTQRGVPVEEGSPYYHNNAKYWAEVVASRAAELGELTAEARQAIDDANAAVRAAAGAAHDATEADAAALTRGKAADLALQRFGAHLAAAGGIYLVFLKACGLGCRNQILFHLFKIHNSTSLYFYYIIIA